MKTLLAAFRILLAIIGWCCIIILSAWLTGRILTDRFYFSQWLWWIPTPAAVAIAFLGLLTVLRPAAKRKRRIIVWSVLLGGLLIYFGVIEHRFHRGMKAVRKDTALKIIHWNVQPSAWIYAEPSLQPIIDFDADITLLTNPGVILHHDKTREWAANGRHFTAVGAFAVFSRQPIRSVRPVVAADQMWVAVIEFEPQQPFEFPLIVYLIDLPSDLNIPRMPLARRLRTMLDEMKLPPPDLVAGDFNITRGSASIAHLFPGLSHAFNTAGHGYGASYHREWPLYHIDHLLFGDRIVMKRYDLLDPGIGRHHAQQAFIAPKQRKPDSGKAE